MATSEQQLRMSLAEEATCPSRQLDSTVQILAQGVPPVAPPREGSLAEGHLMCPEHDKNLTLFCQEDQTPICVSCWESREHQDHKVLPVGEAAKEYKDKFQSYLDNMKMNLENILGLQHREETKVTDLEGNLKSQKERISSVFNKVQQFLEKEKCRHLNNLEEKEKRVLQEIRKKVTEFDEQQVLFRSLITEMKSKSQQPDVELLKDAKSMLNRCENLNSLNPDPEPSIEHKKQTEEKECVVEEKDLERKIKESLEWRWARSFAGEVTLDPDTAHQELVLSEDGRSVRHGGQAQDLEVALEGYNSALCVLGRERLSSDRCYWEVEVGDKTAWSLGVCDESVSRKWEITLAPEVGYWVVWLIDNKREPLTTFYNFLNPSEPPSVVGLFLDRVADQLSVYNVADRSLFFTIPEDSFPHTLRPFFNPELSIGGKNRGALTILQVTGWE